MTTTKHTPGPWALTEDWFIVDTDGDDIADIVSASFRGQP